MHRPTIKLQLHHTLTTCVTPTRRVCEVASMFGLGVDERKVLDVIPPMSLTLAPGRLIFITGASGGGKTTLLREVRRMIERRDDVRVIDFDELGTRNTQLGMDPSLIDALGDTLEEAVRYLSLAGLNDAHVMLRKPSELSDGQRYRWRLARAMHAADQSSPLPLGEVGPPGPGEGACCTGGARCGTAAHCRAPSPQPSPSGRGGQARLPVVLADEFGATLDRMTASILARNVRKWTRRAGVCVLAATTHDDLLESLEPDVLIVQHPGAGIEVMERSP